MAGAIRTAFILLILACGRVDPPPIASADACETACGKVARCGLTSMDERGLQLTMPECTAACRTYHQVREAECINHLAGCGDEQVAACLGGAPAAPALSSL